MTSAFLFNLIDQCLRQNRFFNDSFKSTFLKLSTLTKQKFNTSIIVLLNYAKAPDRTNLCSHKNNGQIELHAFANTFLIKKPFSNRQKS